MLVVVSCAHVLLQVLAGWLLESKCLAGLHGYEPVYKPSNMALRFCCHGYCMYINKDTMLWWAMKQECLCCYVVVVDIERLVAVIVVSVVYSC